MTRQHCGGNPPSGGEFAVFSRTVEGSFECPPSKNFVYLTCPLLYVILRYLRNYCNMPEDTPAPACDRFSLIL